MDDGIEIMEALQQIDDVPVVIANHNGLIIYVNDKFEEIFLWLRSEVIGKPLTIIIPKELHDAHNLGFSRFLTTEKSTILNQHLQLIAVKKTGQKFAAEHFIQATRHQGQWIFGATIRPIEKNEMTHPEKEILDAR